MEQMNEKKALEIMQLTSNATKDDISKRYGILARKFKTIEKDDKGYTIEDISKAYNLLMGITFTDKNEEARQRAIRENPPLLARILKKDPVKLENFFHYYKIHMLVTVGVIIFLFFAIRSCINQVPTDFTLVFYGNIYGQDTVEVENDVKERLIDISAPSVQIMNSNSEDPQFQYAIQMKFVAMIAAQEVDVIIMDKESFESYIPQGIFLPLNDKVNELGFDKGQYVKGHEIIGESDNGEPIEGELKAYGIDISESPFIKDNNIYAEDAVVAIVQNTAKMDKAMEFIKSLNK